MDPRLVLGNFRPHRTMAAAVATGVLLGVIGLEACSSSSSNGFGPGSSDASTGKDGPVASTTCANPTLKIDFSPMFSAFIPGSAMHVFQVPAVLDDGSEAAWAVTDSTVAQVATQTFAGVPGVMITVQGTNTVTVVATGANGACGTSTLKITSATEDDWQIGNQRYNDGVALHLGPPPGFEGGMPMPPPDGGGFRTMDGGSFFEQEGGTACTNCHGPTATNGPFNDVSHTPEQTGGFSDDDLIAIITQGLIPDGGYFDPNVIISGCDGSAACATQAYDRWHAFHKWTDISSDQYKGIVVYLRSLTPAPQNGNSNFGGRGPRPDGGFPPPSGDGG